MDVSSSVEIRILEKKSISKVHQNGIKKITLFEIPAGEGSSKSSGEIHVAGKLCMNF